MHLLLRALTVLAVGIAAIAASAATAGADPNGMVVDLHCGDAHYTVVTVGNGEFTPAHDLHSTTVFVPLAFGDFTGTLTHVESGSSQTFADHGSSTKGNSQPRRRTVLDCTYTFTDEFVAGPDDGLIEGDAYVFTGMGEVTLFASGPR